MVHLGCVQNDSHAPQKTSAPDIKGLQLGPPDTLDEDATTSNVYGSSFASRELPTHEMPDDEMPREVAYRLIKCVHRPSL